MIGFATLSRVLLETWQEHSLAAMTVQCFTAWIQYFEEAFWYNSDRFVLSLRNNVMILLKHDHMVHSSQNRHSKVSSTQDSLY